MRHDDGRRWDDILYGPLEVCDDGFGEEVVVGCYSFRKVFGEVIPIFFELVLPLLSGLIEQLAESPWLLLEDEDAFCDQNL